MTATGCPKPAMRSVEFARSYNVRLHVRSAFTWEPGTIVTDSKEELGVEEASVIAVTHDTADAKVTVTGVADRPGVAATLFRRLAEEGINVDMIVQNVSDGGQTDISFTVPAESFDASLAACRQALGAVDASGVSGEEQVGKVSIVGSGMKSDPGVAARMFETLAAVGVNIEMISTSPIRTSCVVRQHDVERAVQALHSAFGLDVV
jgi:aspartate kinase